MKKIILILFLSFLGVACLFYWKGLVVAKDFLSLIWFIPLTIVALFQEEIKKVLFAPKLEIEFRLKEPHCLKTKMVASHEQKQVEWPAYFFRFRVKNTGESIAKRCECVIEELWFEKKGRWIKEASFQAINLNWSNAKSADEFLDINPKCPGWFCDLVHVERLEAYSSVDNMYPSMKTTFHSKDMVFDYKPPFPNSQYHKVQVDVKHKVKVAVYSENASPVSKIFEIFWSGEWTDDVEEMFKKIQIIETE